MISILFVCLGNICRSPMAETIFSQLIKENHTESQFHVDSAGLIGFHEGETADRRMRAHARQRGYEITHRSRPVIHSDFDRFDYIIGMDDQNIRDLIRMTRNSELQPKIYKITDFLQYMKADAVPDPYYGEDSDFLYVIDLLEDAGKGLYNALLKKNKTSRGNLE